MVSGQILISRWGEVCFINSIYHDKNTSSKVDEIRWAWEFKEVNRDWTGGALLSPLNITPVRTLSISGLNSRVMKLPFLSLKMMVKSGLEFILKFTEPLQRYLLSCQANSAIHGRYFSTGQQQLGRGSVNFKIKF